MKTSKTTNFALIETFLWEKKSYYLLDLHLKRLKKSAAHFSFCYIEKNVLAALKKLSASFAAKKKYKVRLLLVKSGGVTLDSMPLENLGPFPLKVIISKKRAYSGNIFLYHKTTNRALYDRELKTCREKGFFDVIFMNEKSEITEGAITNIIIKKGKSYFTPPVSCGLLPGVYREHLLKSRDAINRVPTPKERILHKEDLLAADKIFLINSVRKTVPVRLIM